MKLFSWYYDTYLLENFLTHTVQMKPQWLGILDPVKLKLLNPHGSDETRVMFMPLQASIDLLNPHGSDETHQHSDSGC